MLLTMTSYKVPHEIQEKQASDEAGNRNLALGEALEALPQGPNWGQGCWPLECAQQMT